jgi:probable HAF family extracellular repeat protein
MMIGTLSRRVLPLGLGLALVGLAACSDDLTGPTGTGQAELDITGLTSGVILPVDLGPQIGGDQSWALDVNDFGEVLGEREVGSSKTFFLYDRNDVLTDIDAAVPSWSLSDAGALNNAGQVVGYGYAGAAGLRGFRWSAAGGIERLDPPSSSASYTLSYAFGINDAGEAVGMSLLTDGFRATTWRPGAGTGDPLQVQDVTFTKATDINELSDISGVGTFLDGTISGLIWNSVVHRFGSLGGDDIEANAINESSHVVGYSKDEDGVTRPFLWDGGDIMALDIPDSDYGVAWDINDEGYIVGERQTLSGQVIATLWTPQGAVRDLPALGGEGMNSYARGINKDGAIVGFSEIAPDVYHATAWNLSDEGGGEEEKTPEELIDELREDVRAMVDDGTLRRGWGWALMWRLRWVDRLIQRDRLNVAANVLNAFRNHVRALVRSGRLTQEEAQPLLDKAEQAIDLLRDEAD